MRVEPASYSRGASRQSIRLIAILLG